MATKFRLVGRYMNGNQVEGYQLVDDETRQARMVTRDQMLFLVGGQRVVNCRGQINGMEVLLRGKGFDMKDLPVLKSDGTLDTRNNAAATGRGLTGADAAMAMQRVIIVEAVVCGRRTVGYITQDTSGNREIMSRNRVLFMAKNGLVGNARVQMNNGSVILRGVGCNLSGLNSRDLAGARQLYKISRDNLDEISADIEAMTNR